MNLNHLAIFHAVAESGSVSAAAKRLHISQPAVSKQLREFEEKEGLPLFDRLPKGMRLTAAGEMLRAYARQIFAAEEDAERRLAELRGLQSGRLAIGASTTIGNYLLPVILTRFQQLYPGVEVQLDIANTEIIQSRLLANTLDLGFTEGFVDNAQFDARVLGMDELVLIAAPTHPLFKRTDLTAAEVFSEPCILREAGSGTRAVIERALRARGINLETRMSLGSPEAIKQAVAAGAGISLVSRLTVATELLAGTLRVVPVSDLHLERPLHQISLTHKSPSRTVERFLALLADWRPPGTIRQSGFNRSGDAS